MKTEEIVHIVLEDDTEILGNGVGHVMYRQYLPVLKYIDILKKNDVVSTFYVDIAHLLFLKKNIDFKDFKLQADLIEKMILLLLDSNMEVQLHIHSQWVNAEIKDDHVFVTSRRR